MGKKSGDTVIQQTPQVDANQLNAQQLALNRITQFGPLGELQFGTVDPSGEFIQNTGTITSDIANQQAASRLVPTDAQDQVLANTDASSIALSGLGADISQELNATQPSFEGLDPNVTNIDFSQISALPQIGDFSEDALRFEEATFNQGLSRLQPTLDRRDEQLRQRLADQGLPVGSEAADFELDAAGRTSNDLLTSLANSSVGAGRQEQQRQFGNALAVRGQELSDFMTDAQLQNLGRSTAFTEQSGERASSFNELASLLGLNQVAQPNIGQFFTPSAIDVVGSANAQTAAANAANQAALGQAQISAQQESSTFGSLAQLGGTLGAAAIKCGREFKHRMRPELHGIANKVCELNVERWQYRDDDEGTEHLGPYADEFERIFGLGNGHEIPAVDAVGVCLKAIQEIIEAGNDLERRVNELEAING